MNEDAKFGKVELVVQGMTWIGWEPKVAQALEGLPGVDKAVVSFAEKKATIRYNPDSITLDQMKEALLKVGYVASLSNTGKQNRNISGVHTQERIEFRGDELVCYCFEYTRNDIEKDYLKNGRSTILEKIASEKKSGGCDCANKNPKGLWCLADVRQVVDWSKEAKWWRLRS